MYNFGYAMGGIRDGLASAAVIDAGDAWLCAEKVSQFDEQGADVVRIGSYLGRWIAWVRVGGWRVRD